MRRKGIPSYFNLTTIYIGIILTIVLDVFVFRQLELKDFQLYPQYLSDLPSCYFGHLYYILKTNLS